MPDFLQIFFPPIIRLLSSRSFQLRRPPLRGGEGLQQVRGLPARRELRGQPLPQLLERRLRGVGVALRPVQLGRPPPRQRQGGAQAREGQVRQSQVSGVPSFSLLEKLLGGMWARLGIVPIN